MLCVAWLSHGLVVALLFAPVSGASARSVKFLEKAGGLIRNPVQCRDCLADMLEGYGPRRSRHPSEAGPGFHRAGIGRQGRENGALLRHVQAGILQHIIGMGIIGDTKRQTAVQQAKGGMLHSFAP